MRCRVLLTSLIAMLLLLTACQTETATSDALPASPSPIAVEAKPEKQEETPKGSDQQATIHPLLREAADLRRSGEYDAALKKVQRVLELNPDSVAAQAMEMSIKDAQQLKKRRQQDRFRPKLIPPAPVPPDRQPFEI